MQTKGFKVGKYLDCHLKSNNNIYYLKYNL